MRYVLVFAGVGLWIAVLLGCGGGGDSSSAPAVADGAMTPGDTPGAASPTPGDSDPTAQGSATTDSGTPGSSSGPSPEGSGTTGPSGTPADGTSSGMPADSSADQPPASGGASDSQTPGATPDSSDSSASTPGGSENTMPEGVSAPPSGYPEGAMSPDSSSSPSGDSTNPDGSASPDSGNMTGQQAPKPLTLVEKAVLAFRQGRDQDAIAYLCAHGVTAEASEAKTVLDQMGWIVPLKRPAMALRWGIAMEYVPLRNYDGNIFPIGTTQNLPARGAAGQAPGGQPAGGMPDMTGGQPGMGGGAHIPPLMQQLTGELGPKVVAQLQERIARGDFGQAMASLGKADVPAAGGAAPGMGGYGETGGSGMSPDMGGGMAGIPGGFGGPAQPQGAPPAQATPLAPGIVFLGIVTPKDMRQKAQQAGVDVICVFNIVLTAIPKQQLLKNETEIHLYDLVQTRKLFESKTLNNIQVQIERVEKKADQDPVERELESLFKFVDANWRMGPLPAGMQAEHVLNRLRILLAESHENPLPVLAEARMYQMRGLLQDAHFLTACQKLLGESEGTQLANGSAEEKLETVAKWLPQGP